MKINAKARTLLWKEVEGITDEILNKKTTTDKWSIKQILEHLYLCETAFTRMIEKQLAGGEIVHAKDQPVERTVDRSYKVQSPEIMVPGDTYKTLVELRELLNSSHEKMIKIAKNADPEELEGKGIPHPAFGYLNLRQTIAFVGYHEMRHIEQIKEAKEGLGLLKSNY
ncbi:DinB family protein [Ornithinibacillus salinisoli]|uniref:DinB family protein n=1 Tax=Ornithinibacillus salinisoli TaxID=1848459 RepID=A0ABW4VUL3_9BACI